MPDFRLGLANIVDHNDQCILAHGTDKPPSGTDGYAPGGLFIDTDSGVIYVNNGSATSSTFDTMVGSGGIYFGDLDTNGACRVRRDSTYPTILLWETRIGGSWVAFKVEVYPSGDATGATDKAAINYALATYDFVHLSGAYTTNGTLVISRPNSSLFGSGFGATITLTTGSYPAVKIGTLAAGVDNVTIKDLWIDGTDAGRFGTVGILLENASYCHFRGVKIAHLGSHGMHFTGNTWDLILTDCQIWGNNGDGINSEGDATYANGNQLCLQGCFVHTNGGNGLTYAATGLNVTGCLFENNTGYAIHLKSNANRPVYGVSLTGNHFENASGPSVAITGTTGKLVQGVNIAGNSFNGGAADGHVVCLGDADTVQRLKWCESNFANTTPSYDVWENGALKNGDIKGDFDSDAFYEGSGDSSVCLWDENGSVSWRASGDIGAYWGRPTTEGAWRATTYSSGVTFWRRESATWIKRFMILPTYVEMDAPAAVPTLSGNAKLAFYLDEVGHNLKVIVKYSGGTSKTATIPLV